MNYLKFKMNYYLPTFCLIYLIGIIATGDINFYQNIFLLLGLVFFIGSLLLLWQMEIDDNGIIITYLIPLGRNREFAWDDIFDMRIIVQKHSGIKLKELIIIPVNDKKIKFFRLGILGYSILCDLAIQTYKEKKPTAV